MRNASEITRETVESIFAVLFSALNYLKLISYSAGEIEISLREIYLGDGYKELPAVHLGQAFPTPNPLESTHPLDNEQFQDEVISQLSVQVNDLSLLINPITNEGEQAYEDSYDLNLPAGVRLYSDFDSIMQQLNFSVCISVSS